MIEERASHRQDTWRDLLAHGMWGTLAGIVGSLCCIGPSAALLIGLGSSSALFGLHVDQSLALGGGILMLSVGCGIALRQSRQCHVRAYDRWRHAGLILVPGILTYLLLGMLAPVAATRHEAAAPLVPIAAPVAASHVLHRATFLVEKMDCPPCVAHIRSLLARKPFVTRFAADVGNDQITVVYDSAQIDAQALLALFPPPYRATLSGDAPL